MPRAIPDDWYPGNIPDNVDVDPTAHIDTSQCFEKFRSRMERGLTLGRGASIYLPTMFDVGERGRVTVGELAMLNGPRIICDERIEIGDYVLISWNVVLMDTYRMPLDANGRRQELTRIGRAGVGLRWPDAGGSARPIRIENNVWIGFDAIVLPGVTIGAGSIVGTRSVVGQDVPPRSIVAGNPARRIRGL